VHVRQLGELTQDQRTDTSTGVAVVHQIIWRYDALGRMMHTEEQVNGTVDPETVSDYIYDQPINFSSPVEVTATNTLGRLTQAISQEGVVSFGYDGLGHVASQVFTDDQSNIYFEKHSYHADGTLETTDLQLPDNHYADEQISYGYDSAARLASVLYVEVGGG
jgi:YD repeat-containing protein